MKIRIFRPCEPWLGMFKISSMPLFKIQLLYLLGRPGILHRGAHSEEAQERQALQHQELQGRPNIYIV